MKRDDEIVEREPEFSTTRRIRTLTPNGSSTEREIDLSETMEKIRKRWERRVRNGNARIEKESRKKGERNGNG